MPRTDALSRLDDPEHDNYDDPSPCPAGCDLAGILYASSTSNTYNKSAGRERKLDRAKSSRTLFVDLNFEDDTETIRAPPPSPSPRRTPVFRHRKTKSAAPEYIGQIDPVYANTETHNIHPLQQIQSERIQSESSPSQPSPVLVKTTNVQPLQRIQRIQSESPPAQPSPVLVKNINRITITTTNNAIIFRDINSLVQDPDTAKSRRLSLIQEAGFTHAAGIHFNNGGVEGVVIYYTTIGSELNQPFDIGSPEGQRTLANEFYLLRATELIGAAVACIEARRAITVMMRRCYLSTLEAANENNSNVENQIDDGDTKPKSKTRKAMKAWWHKCKGAKMQMPPGFSWGEAMFSFAGSLISLLLLMGIMMWFKDKGVLVPLGPLSSVIASQYLLCPAPASQPRTTFLGLTISGTIGMLFSYIPTWILPRWARQAFATASAIFAMGKLGISHPPSAGFALTIAAGTPIFPAWISFAATVCAGIFLTAPAILINNLNKNRQYPTYWFHGPYHWLRDFGFSCAKKIDKKKDFG
jgi:hypothetical protein